MRISFEEIDLLLLGPGSDEEMDSDGSTEPEGPDSGDNDIEVVEADMAEEEADDEAGGGESEAGEYDDDTGGRRATDRGNTMRRNLQNRERPIWWLWRRGLRWSS